MFSSKKCVHELLLNRAIFFSLFWDRCKQCTSLKLILYGAAAATAATCIYTHNAQESSTHILTLKYSGLSTRNWEWKKNLWDSRLRKSELDLFFSQLKLNYLLSCTHIFLATISNALFLLLHTGPAFSNVQRTHIFVKMKKKIRAWYTP